jgi:hypothetical protein
MFSLFWLSNFSSNILMKKVKRFLEILMAKLFGIKMGYQ